MHFARSKETMLRYFHKLDFYNLRFLHKFCFKKRFSVFKFKVFLSFHRQ